MTLSTLEEKYDKKDVKNLNADKRAKARGLVVVEPKPNELFVDIDREEDMTVFRRNLGWLEGLVTGFDVKPSCSPNHYHITVRLSRDVRDGYERIALQALLGSDRLREVLSWRNLVNESGRPTVFFEKPSNELPLQPGEPIVRSVSNPPEPVKESPGEVAARLGLPPMTSEGWMNLIENLLPFFSALKEQPKP